MSIDRRKMEDFGYWEYWEPWYGQAVIGAEKVTVGMLTRSERVRAYISQEEARGVSLDKLILSGRIYLAKKDLGEEVPDLHPDEEAFINAVRRNVVRPDIRLVVDLIKFYCCAFADVPEVVEILRPLEDAANWSNFDYERLPVADEGNLYLHIGDAAAKAHLSDESTRCILQYFFDDHAIGGNDALREQISLGCRKMCQYLPPIFTSKKIESLLSQSYEELAYLRIMRKHLLNVENAEVIQYLDNPLQCLDERIENIEEALRQRVYYPFEGCVEAKAYLLSDEKDLDIEYHGLADFPEGIRLKTATLKKLKNAGIHCIWQLLEFSRDDLLHIRGFGRGRLEEVIGFLYAIGYNPDHMGRLSF